MPKVSAGLLMVRWVGLEPEFLLAHPGGPFFQNRDDGVWTLPKGMVMPSEDLLDAARREFFEETGITVKAAVYESLGSVRQKGGKIVHAWAFAGDCDPSAVRSNTYPVEWPPRSGRMRWYPEVDRAEFFNADMARVKLIEAQVPFIDRALERLGKLGLTAPR